MVARSNLACFALFFLSIVLITHSMSEARVCRDQLCNEPISVGRVIKNFEGTTGKDHLSLKQGDNVYVYAKNPDETPEMWFGQVNGKDGYFPREVIEEYVVYEPNPSFVVSKEILEDSDDGSASDSDKSDKKSENSEDTTKEKPSGEKNNEKNTEDGEYPKDNSHPQSGEGSSQFKGTMSGIMDSLSDFFSLPAGEEYGANTLSTSEKNTNSEISQIDNDKNPEKTKNVIKNNENVLENPPNKDENYNKKSSESDSSGLKVEKSAEYVEHITPSAAEKDASIDVQAQLFNGSNSEIVKNNNSEIVKDSVESQNIKNDINKRDKDDVQNDAYGEEMPSEINEVDSDAAQPKHLVEPLKQEQKPGKELPLLLDLGNQEPAQIVQDQEVSPQVLQYVNSEQLQNQPNPSQYGHVIQDPTRENVPDKQNPTQDVPDKQDPTQDVPDKQDPTQDVPDKQVSLQDVPNMQDPAQDVPDKQEPIQDVPEKQVPLQNVPGKQVPVQNVPDKQVPSQDIPVKQNLFQGIPQDAPEKQDVLDIQDPLENHVDNHGPSQALPTDKQDESKENKELDSDTYHGTETDAANQEKDSTKIAQRNETLKDDIKSDAEASIEDALSLEIDKKDQISSLPEDKGLENTDEQVLRDETKKLPQSVQGEPSTQEHRSDGNVHKPIQAGEEDKEESQNDQESKKSLEEVVKNVQENLKAVVEEDLKNHFQKANAENHHQESIPHDEHEQANNIVDSTGGNGAPSGAQQKLLFKKEAILSQKRKMKEQEEALRASGDDKEKQENLQTANEESSKTGVENSDGDKEDEEEEEDYEEVEPVRRNVNSSLSELSEKTKGLEEGAHGTDKVIDTAAKINEGMAKIKQEEEKRRALQGDEKAMPEGNYTVEGAQQNQTESVDNKDEEKTDEKAQEERLRLLREERRRVEALNKQAAILAARKKALEKKLEEERQFKEQQRLQEQRERKAKEEEEKRVFEERQEELKRAREEEQQRLQREEEQKHLREEQQRKAREEEQRRLLEEQKQRKAHEEEERRKTEEEKKQQEVEKLRKEEERRLRIKLEVEKRLKAIEEEKRKAEEAKKERERREQEQKEKERLLKELEDQRKKEAELKKIEEEKQRKANEAADQLKEEMEIEAALKERLAALSSSKAEQKDSFMVKHEPSKIVTNLKGKEEGLAAQSHGSRFAPSRKEKDFAVKPKRIPPVMPNLIQNKFKKFHTKASKIKGSSKHGKKKGRKKKKKTIDKEFIHLDHDTCMSIPIKEREPCALDVDEDECHEDGCCFDEDGPPDLQCFWPPTEPVSSSDFEDEEDDVSPKRRLDAKDKTKTPPVKRKPEITTTTTTTTTATTTKQNINPTPSSLYTTTTTPQTSAMNDIKQIKVTSQQDSTNVETLTSQISKAQEMSSAALKDGTPYAKEIPVQDKILLATTSTLPATSIPAENQDKGRLEKDKKATAEPPDANKTTGQETAASQEDITKKQEFNDIIGKQTPPTSPADIHLSTENVTEGLRSKSFGIVKGFWRFHQTLAEGVMYYGQPVKGAVRGTLGFIGLGQLFDDICQDLATAPPLVLVCTILVGSLGAVFLLCTCISSINSKGEASGPSLRDILKTYEARIRILEEERDGLQKDNREMDVKLHYAMEEKHHAEDGANTARKSLEHVMLKVKQYEEEQQELQAIININKENIQAYIEELEKKDEEFEHVQKMLGDYKIEIKSNEDTIEQLKEEISKLEDSNAVRDEEVRTLNAKIDSQEEEKDELCEKIKEWNNKFDKLQENLDDEAVRSSQIQEQYDFKCNEVEVLQDCLLQIKGQESEDDEEQTNEEERDKARAERLKAMLDASKSKTEAKIIREENVQFRSELEEVKTNKEALEEKIQDLEQELSKAKLSEEKAYLDFREKEIELTALRKYFKDTESELHRKLTAEESAREATEYKLQTELSKASADSKDLVTYKKLYKDINEEIQRVKGNVNHQVAQVEERAHNNWLKYRTVERELDEVKRERDALRRRLYSMDKEKNRPGSSQSVKSSDSADGLRSESPLRGPPPPGAPGGRVPDHHSPVPIGPPPPPPMHPMYGPHRMPMGFGPPPPPGRYGPPPPRGHLGTPAPGRHNTPPPMRNDPASDRQGVLSPSNERDNRRKDSHGFDPNDRRSGRRSLSPPRDHGNHMDTSPNLGNRPPVSTSTPSQSKISKQNSLESDGHPNESPTPYAPYPSGSSISTGSPMMRHPPPVRPPYGPLGHSPLRPPYGPPMVPSMGPPMGLSRPPPPAQPMGLSSNAYRRVPGPRPPTGPS